MVALQQKIKHSLDRLAALALVVAALPVLVSAAVWIKLASRGPVLFTQERIGLGEHPFRIFKFRTMRLGAAQHTFGSVTVTNDPRLFRGAHSLRKFKIDELPQLFNVLNGTMSLVGPRPTVDEDYRRMTPEQRRRATVKPGLTGLAQINGGAALPWPRRIEFDLDYIRNYSLWLDAAILARTGLLVLSGQADTNPLSDDEWADPTESGTAPSKDPLPLRKAA